MPCVVLCFELHQPIRLRKYSAFDTDSDYFDDALNAQTLRRVAEQCYRPALEILRRLVRRHKGRFRLSLSITGLLIEQLRQHSPDVLEILADLGSLDGVEFLNETYYHSLAWLQSRDEFEDQIAEQARVIEALTGQRPTALRNTGLIYDDALGAWAAGRRRYDAVLVEGADRALGGRTVHQLYRPPRSRKLALVPRHYGLSDDLTFRFTSRQWAHWPLTPARYAHLITRTAGLGPVCVVSLDLETFGEYHRAETGILAFLAELPAAVLGASLENSFMTVSQAAAAYPPEQVMQVPAATSWADTERDTSAWLVNAMQTHAARELYSLERSVKKSNDPVLLRDWRLLTQSDHLYYMCTKFSPDMAVHNRFNPHGSPYDAYIYFMNVLENFRHRLLA